jgi:hypothetical protein
MLYQQLSAGGAEKYTVDPRFCDVKAAGRLEIHARNEGKHFGAEQEDWVNGE